MSGTNVPSPTLGPTGFIATPAPAVLTGVQADWAAALGSGLNLSLDTGQGQIISSEAALVADSQAQFLWVQQQSDPAYAVGRNQDAIGRYYFLTRIPATSTVATCQCAGVAAVIPQGALIIAEDSNTYTAVTSGTLPLGGGTITLNFACTATGPIACPAQTFTIGQSIGGWDTCLSTGAGALGQNVETRQAFETRRALSVEGNSVNTNQSVLGALLGANGGQPLVSSAYVTSNNSGSSVVSGGVTLSANSIYVAFYAGSVQATLTTGPFAGASGNQAIADTVWTKVPPGTPYTGNTTLTVQDPNPAYLGNGPSYSVILETASTLTINGAVTIKNSTGVPSNAGSLITTAFQNAFAGLDGLPPASIIGATTLFSRFIPGIQALGAWAQPIQSMLIGTSTANTLSVASNINQVPTAGTISLTLD